MMYVYRSGWVAGETLQACEELRRFADQGWLVVSVHYRLATEAPAI